MASTSIPLKVAAPMLGVSVDTLYRWRNNRIALPPGWSWDDVPGRQVRLVPPVGTNVPKQEEQSP